jgi:transposase-like protein
MSKRIIPIEEKRQVLMLARSGMHLRAIKRATGVSTNGIMGICDRAGVRLVKAKRGPQKQPVQSH